MDPTLLAQAAIATLAPFLVKSGEEIAKRVGEATFNQAQKLWQLLREKVRGDAAGAQALQKLEIEPGTPARQTAAAVALGDVLAADAELRQQIEAALAQLTQALPAGFSVNVSGSGRVDQVVQVGRVERDLVIGKREP